MANETALSKEKIVQIAMKTLMYKPLQDNANLLCPEEIVQNAKQMAIHLKIPRTEAAAFLIAMLRTAYEECLMELQGFHNESEIERENKENK